MSTILNVPQKGETDVFRSFLVKNATYEGVEEIPKIRTSNYIPEKVISFSKAVSGKVFNRWVHFTNVTKALNACGEHRKNICLY